MMQYRLSTLFVIFFVVAATMALFGVWGVWIAGVLLLAALCLNRANRLWNGVRLCSLLIFVGIVCPWLALPAVSMLREASLRANCTGLHLQMIGAGLDNYVDFHKKFPPVYTCDKNGKPLYSWLVEIMPMLEYDSLYNSLKKDEPWNSPYNAKILSIHFPECECPIINREKNDFSTNYMAIIGPGTIWKAEGSKKRSDLPNDWINAVVAVEVVDSGIHWAEPFALTVDEVLDNMRTGKGVRISTCHRNGVNVLFADGRARTFPTKMPLELWRKILMGELSHTDLYNIELDGGFTPKPHQDLTFDPNAPDMVDVYLSPPEPKRWAIILGGLVWLSSIVLFFHRAVKSREKPETENIIPPTPLAS